MTTQPPDSANGNGATPTAIEQPPSLLENVGFQSALNQIKAAAHQLEIIDPQVVEALTEHMKRLRAHHDALGNTPVVDQIAIDDAILRAVRHFKGEIKTIAERAESRARLRGDVPAA